MRLPLPRRAGLTLMELLVVLTILVALAGVVVPLLSNQVSSSQLDSTYQSMLAIRQAIMGQPSYYMDTKGLSFTRSNPTATSPTADHAGMPATLNDLFVNPGITMANTLSFDPLSQKGWRGPYLNQTMGNLNTTYNAATGLTTTYILNSFPPSIGSNPPTNQIYLEWPGNPASAPGSPATDTSTDNISQVYQYFRLRTPGPSGKLVNPTTNAWIPTTSGGTLTNTTYGDNLILYIRLDLPGVDWTNYYYLKQTLGN